MKKTLLILLFLIPSIAFLQPSKDKSAPYLKTIGYPDIRLLLPDSSSIFTKESLPKDKTVVIIFFSPNCEHCQAEAKEMMTKMDSVSNLFMVWNANMMDDFKNVQEFYYNYGFNKYDNIILGRETNYYLPLFYRLENTPYAAVYKNGKLFTEFRNTLNLKDLIAINYNKYVEPVISVTPILKKKKKKSRK